MSVGILIVSHQYLGQAVAAVSRQMLDPLPLALEVLEICEATDPDAGLASAVDMVEKLDSGAGVLILTDIYGSTPSNIATRLLETHNVAVVSGLSLPMMARVLSYPDLSLAQLAEKAISGAQDGVVLCHRNKGNDANRAS